MTIVAPVRSPTPEIIEVEGDIKVGQFGVIKRKGSSPLESDEVEVEDEETILPNQEKLLHEDNKNKSEVTVNVEDDDEVQIVENPDLWFMKKPKRYSNVKVTKEKTIAKEGRSEEGVPRSGGMTNALHASCPGTGLASGSGAK